MKTEYTDTLIESGTFVEIFDDNAEESFFGYITQQSEAYLQLESYDSEGRSEGVLIVENEDIARIRWEGNERELIESLITSRANQPKIQLDDMRSIIEGVDKHYGYICITLGGYGVDKLYIGSIESMNEVFVILHEYGTREQKCRNKMLVRIEDISRVQAGGIYETNLIKQQGASLQSEDNNSE
ncbi:MAG: hypothetical protein ACSHYA_17735 [Opitutaceae bacterium]